MTPRMRKNETTGEEQISGTTASDLPLPDLPSPSFDESMTRLMVWPVETWLRCHAGMLKATEPTATGWIARRREGATAVLNTFEKLAKCNDLQEIASIHRDWIEGTLLRLDSDLHALADHAVALSHEAMTATRDAAQTSTEIVGLAVQASGRNENDVAAEQAA
jgi:hypothetical protein